MLSVMPVEGRLAWRLMRNERGRRGHKNETEWHVYVT